MALLDVTPRSSNNSDAGDCQFVFLMVLDDDRKKLLMLEQDGECYPPFFEYTYRSARHMAKACLQLQKKLGIEMSRQYFTAVFDTLDILVTFDMNGKETTGYSNFLLVESSCSNFAPQPPAAWHDIDSVSRVAEETHRSRGPSNPIHNYIFEIALQFLRGEYPRPYLTDIRYRPGWFQRASAYFTSTLVDNAIPTMEPVFQYSYSETSTLLALNTEYGRYYLKSPAAGCDELIVTKAILEHLPEYTLNVIGTNDELNCFISESFERLEELDLGDEKEDEIMVTVLARLHLDSRVCVQELEASGIQNRSPLVIKSQVNKWADGDPFMSPFVYLMMVLAQNLDMINRALMMVHKSNVPLTLVHGDVFPSNFGRRKFETGDAVWILHDWQFGCISHPFFDLHRIYKDLSPAVKEKYLAHWTEFATMEELKKLLPIACNLAWLLKAWSAIECLKSCSPGLGSTLLEFVLDCIDETARGMRDYQNMTHSCTGQNDDTIDHSQKRT